MDEPGDTFLVVVEELEGSDADVGNEVDKAVCDFVVVEVLVLLIDG